MSICFDMAMIKGPVRMLLNVFTAFVTMKTSFVSNIVMVDNTTNTVYFHGHGMKDDPDFGILSSQIKAQ